MDKKLAIICSGGGMSCSYTAGFLSALANEYNLTDPDIVIAGSGSAGTASYYVAKQYDSVTNIWENLLSTKKFINKLRLRRIIDIDYLIDTVFKVEEPLDVETIKTSRINFIIPATNIDTGRVVYFSNEDHVDIFEAMRATKAMPILYNKKVQINGSKYCDSRLSSAADLDIMKAVGLGATHILVISNDKDNDFENFAYHLWLKSRSKKFQHKYFTLEKLCESKENYPNVNILHISAKKKIPAGMLDSKQEHLRSTIELGYSDCKKSKQLREFIYEYLAK